MYMYNVYIASACDNLHRARPNSNDVCSLYITLNTLLYSAHKDGDLQVREWLDLHWLGPGFMRRLRHFGELEMAR